MEFMLKKLELAWTQIVSFPLAGVLPRKVVASAQITSKKWHLPLRQFS